MTCRRRIARASCAVSAEPALADSGRVGPVDDLYGGLAADYYLIFDDEIVASGYAVNAPAPARLLRRIDPASTVLDAACGTGIDAAALARRGFGVQATAAGQAMSVAAHARLAHDGV